MSVALLLLFKQFSLALTQLYNAVRHCLSPATRTGIFSFGSTFYPVSAEASLSSRSLIACVPRRVHHIMTFTENLTGLDLYKYQAKVSHYDNKSLENNIYKKRRQCAGGTVGLATGLVTAVHTGGVSLAGALYSSRSISVAKQKLDIMEQEWARRGYNPLDKRKRDVILPVAIGVTAMGVAHGIASGLESAGSSAIHQAANTTQPYEYVYTQWVPTSYGYIPETAVGIGFETVSRDVAAPLAYLHTATNAASHGTSWGINAAGESRMKHRDTTTARHR